MQTATAQTSINERLIMVLAVIFAAVGPFSSDSYLPSLPAMTQVFHSSANTMQLTITIYMLGFSLSQLIYGPLSDRLGRRIVMLIGLAICTVGSLLCSLTTSVLALMFARLVQGAGVGVTNALFRAIMRDTFTGERMAQAASFVGIIFAIAPAVAPITGGYIEAYFGWRANFIFIALLVISVWLIVWRWLPETNKNLDSTATQTKVVIKNYFTLLTSRTFMSHAALSSLGVAGIIAYITASPFLLQTILGLSPVQYGWLAIYIMAGSIFGQVLNSILVTKVGTKRMLLTGITVMLTSGTAMFAIGIAGFMNVYVIMLPVLFFITGGCFVFANAMTNAFHPFPHIAGSAGAMYGFLQLFGAFITSLLVAGIHETNQIPLALIFILLGTLSAVIFYFFISKEP